jgi:hypothetical protein
MTSFEEKIKQYLNDTERYEQELNSIITRETNLRYLSSNIEEREDWWEDILYLDVVGLDDILLENNLFVNKSQMNLNIVYTNYKVRRLFIRSDSLDYERIEQIQQEIDARNNCYSHPLK